MPKIYDNIENQLFKGLNDTLEGALRSDFCVGYFNLRGWKQLAENVEKFSGDDNCCRLMIGMQSPEEDILKEYFSAVEKGLMDTPTALEIKKEIARQFRKQLTFGFPSNNDEAGLKKLKQQLIDGKVKVKLFLKHKLHAKLYLIFRNDKITPIIGYVGSSNLTFAGLSNQGELNVDVTDQDASQKLCNWFDLMWNDRWCIDISKELIEIIDESWAGDIHYSPYYVYLKVAYHLSQEARTGMSNYSIPTVLLNELIPFQEKAVSLAARHLDKRGGVLIGDVVGLGKTLTATAVAKLFEETFFTETLIICPKNLVEMWKDYVHKYALHAHVVSISKINRNFAENERRYRVVIIDESHNLRNRETKRFAIVKEYIQRNDSKVILLTATPYNKTYFDVSNQLRLFLKDDADLGIMPERFIDSIGGEVEFVARYQYSPKSILAFEKSNEVEDWQQLLRMYMVRRTRTFIKNNYATFDEEKQRYFITFPNGKPFYFPDRNPKRVLYPFNEKDKTDLYVRLYSKEVVKIIESLFLARYGIGNYIDKQKEAVASADEKLIIDNLSRAGKRLIGFCRTNLFKRLESSGYAFLISLARLIMRNHLFVYAIDNALPFPIGPQESALADEFTSENDDDVTINIATDINEYRSLAESHYRQCEDQESKFDWISSDLFYPKLKDELVADADAVLSILKIAAKWNPEDDKQLNALEDLLTVKHPKEKVLVFTQFADTANYLFTQLKKRGIKNLECVTGATEHPSSIVSRFSPKSNNNIKLVDELRVLISTDVLSEGQNLQDSHIVVNYDLPWALIRLIQRAGRVDRIGQESPDIFCYSFVPQDGLETIIQLRNRITQRIGQNAEMVGADETFFDGDPVNLRDIYNENSGVFDDDETDADVDITSQAYEIWKQATDEHPELAKKIPLLPDVIFSTKETNSADDPSGVVTYHRNSSGVDILTWLDLQNKVISHNPVKILKAIECTYEEPPLPKMNQHHDLVKSAVELGEKNINTQTGGQLGSQFGARYKAYHRLKRYSDSIKNTLFDTSELNKTAQDVFDYPLKETAKDIINKRIKMSISDEDFSLLCIQLREENRLSIKDESDNPEFKTAQIICSMGLENKSA